MEELSLKIKQKRGGRGIRETAKDIGISPATLSRIEAGKQPDLERFTAICRWLEIDPATILGLRMTSVSASQNEPAQAHFRAHKEMSPETVQHLAKLIDTVQRVSARGL